MTDRGNTGMTNLRRILSVALAGATLAITLTYVLGAPAILQSSFAEPAHNLYMSMFTPLIQGTAGHSSMAQLHGSQALGSQTQMSESQMQEMSQGILGNNVLGSPAGMAAAGLGVVVVQGAAVLAVAAFVISWRQKSFVVAGLLAASGAILAILPLANLNFGIPGPVIGVAVALGILGLGAAKGVKTARVVMVDPR